MLPGNSSEAQCIIGEHEFMTLSLLRLVKTLNVAHQLSSSDVLSLEKDFCTGGV